MPKRTRNLNIALILAGALPTAIVLGICARMLYAIWPDLGEAARYAALEGFFVVALPGASAAATGLWGIYRHKAPGKFVLLAVLMIAIFCFYAVFQIPAHPPGGRNWQFNTDDYMLTLIAGQLPLFYVLIFLLAWEFGINSKRGVVFGVIGTVSAPVLLYFGFNVVRFVPHSNAFAHILQLLFLVLNALFSFLLLRLMIFVARHHAARLDNPRVYVTLQVIFTGVLPLLGLLLNYRGPVAHESQLVLGNFTSGEFWLIALANALVFVMPRFADYGANLLVLALRAAGVVFVLYFCVVFLLFLPLALALIIAFGLGLLLLIPYLALLMQLISLRRDFRYFAAENRTRPAWVAAALGFLLLPVILLVHMYLDRSALRDVIAYVQRPPLALDAEPPASVSRVLRLARPTSAPHRGLRHTPHYVPIYDGLYRSVVFDGAELNEQLRRKLLQVFAGDQPAAGQPLRGRAATAVLESVQTAATGNDGVTRSTLRLRIANPAKSGQAEFDAQIVLPDGAFVAGHWLTIDGVEVPAQITTRNTAIWVYNRVTERLRDPSLLYYEEPGRLRWKVFPVPARGTREARLEILHPYDATISIAGRQINLKAATATAKHYSSTDGTMHLFAPASAAELVTRSPYIHFIVDCSSRGLGDVTAAGKLAAEQLGLDYAQAKVSYVHSAIRTLPMPQDGRLACPQRSGGFFVELALRSVLYSARTSGKNFPLPVVLAATPAVTAWPELGYATMFYADSDGFVWANGKQNAAYSFSGERLTGNKPRFPLAVRGNGFLPARATLAVAHSQNSGDTLAALDGLGHFFAYWAGEHSGRQRAVLHAIQTHMLNPATGSIVLETEGQRRKLAELHQKMLNAHNEFEAGEPRRMSEPFWYLIPALVFVFWQWRRGRKIFSRA